MTKLAGYRVDGCKGCGKAYLVGESHDRSKCAECAGKQVARLPAGAGGQWSLLATNRDEKGEVKMEQHIGGVKKEQVKDLVLESVERWVLA